MKANYFSRGPKYADRLDADRRKNEVDWTVGGINLGLMLCAIGLNDKFGFGKKRLEELESYVNELFFKGIEDCNDDYELLAAKLFLRLQKIRGDGWDE